MCIRDRLTREERNAAIRGALKAGLLIAGVYILAAAALIEMCIRDRSYTIRISATQSYVPDEKKGRFNGAFNMLNTVGSFTGNLLAGALVEMCIRDRHVGNGLSPLVRMHSLFLPFSRKSAKFRLRFVL